MDKVEESLLERLLADRDDLQTWKVYGDLLLQRGEPRGHLINLEVEFDEVRQANRTLSKAYEQAKREHTLIHRPPSSSDYVRKVCKELRARYIDLVARHENERALGKTLRISKASNESRIFGGMLRDSTCFLKMGHLKYLLLRPETSLEPQRFLRVFSSPEIRFLEQLMITLGASEDRVWLEGVMEATERVPVQTLHFRELRLCEGAGETVAARCRPVGLRYLDLKNNRLSDEALGMILANSHFDSIRALHVGGNSIGVRFFKALADGEYLEHLLALSLRGSFGLGAELPNENAALFFNANTVAGVKALDLGQSGLGPGGAVVLSRSTSLQELEHLALDGNEIGDEGVEALAEASSFVRLKRLSLAKNGIGSEGFQALLRSSRLRNLEALCVSDNDLTDGNIDALLGSDAFPELKTFIVQGNGLSDACLERLIDSGRFRELGVEDTPGIFQRNASRVHTEGFLHSLWQDSVEEAVGFSLPIS